MAHIEQRRSFGTQAGRQGERAADGRPGGDGARDRPAADHARGLAARPGQPGAEGGLHGQDRGRRCAAEGGRYLAAIARRHAAIPRTRRSSGCTATPARRGWSMAPARCTAWCWPISSAARARISSPGAPIVDDGDLPRQAANHVPLSPISFLLRAARIYPHRTAVIHGARRYHLCGDGGAQPAAGLGAEAGRGRARRRSWRSWRRIRRRCWRRITACRWPGAVLLTINIRLDAAADRLHPASIPGQVLPGGPRVRRAWPAPPGGDGHGTAGRRYRRQRSARRRTAWARQTTRPSSPAAIPPRRSIPPAR